MISYFIKSGLCLALVLLVYKVLLERERIYVFNRYYLLFGLCFSLVVPFIPMVSSVTIPMVENNPTILIESIQGAPIEIASEEVSNPISGFVYFVGLYAIGCFFFFSRFIANIHKIFQKIAKNTKALYKKASLVLLKENVLPHTFLHYIFIEKEAYDTETIANELYTHELAHVSQRHTLDIILIELIQIVCWFNPLLMYYKKAIQLNHEFLADDAVLKSNTQIPAYQQLLLDNASWNHNLYLASNLNFSVTKKRLEMMTKHTSRVRAWLIASLTIPVFIGALFLFSTKVVAQEATAELIETTKTQPISSQNENNRKGNYYKNATFIFEDENGTKVTKKYAELTVEEKGRLMSPPKTPVAKRPTATLLNDWKSKKDFAIWLDAKGIDNSEISNYDIVYYTGSFVYENARNNRFPQANQMQLYTNSGFEALKKELSNPLTKDAVLNFKKGSHNTKLSSKKANTAKKIERKDIVIRIMENGEFIVNHTLKSTFAELDKNIKAELSAILHKRARNSLIIYHEDGKEFIAKVTAVLKANKIYNIETINIVDLPPPPPPAMKVSQEEAQNVAHMQENIAGHKIETMMIDGKKHYYVVKNGVKFIYNEKSQLVDENGKPIPPPPPPPPKPKHKKKGKI